MSKELGNILNTNPDLFRIEGARRKLLWFAQFVDPKFKATDFHRNYYEVLDKFAHKRIKNLIIQAPPQHGKSQGSSRFLPSFMAGLDPDQKIALASYAATIAKDFNRDVQRIIDTPDYARVFPNTYLNGSNVVTISTHAQRNSDVIEFVGHSGSFRVVGAGGSLTSKTVDVMIIDDLYKDYQEGSSPIVREARWNWYTTVVTSRLHNDSQQLIVFTRWHEEDIIGKLKKTKNVIEIHSLEEINAIEQNADTWVLVNFEAIKTGEPTPIDPRTPGSALWPERHNLESLMSKKSLDAIQFECLYQGNPGDASGKLYQPFKTYIDKSEWGTLIRKGCYIDVADEGTDNLASATYDVYKSSEQIWNEAKRRFEPLLFVLITDIEYTDENTDVTTITVPAMINRNGTERVWVESNNGGSGFEKEIKKKVRAMTYPFYQSGNKESRIVSNAGFVNQCIIMPFGWEKRYPKFYGDVMSFLRRFVANEHDDAPDMLTGIYEKEIENGNALPYGHSNRGIVVRR